MLQRLPLLLIKSLISVESFDGLQRGLVHAISTANNVDVPALDYGHGMIMSGLLQVANFCPLVFRNVVHFAFFWCLIGILWADCINEILGFVIKFSVEMRQLMTWSCIIHEGLLFNLIGQLIDDPALIWEHASDIVFLLLSSDEEYFILTLDWSEFLGQNFGVSDWNFYCCLGIKLMDEQAFLLLIIVVKTRLDTSQNIVWLKGNDIVQESSEFIYFWFHIDLRSGVELHKVDMTIDFVFELIIFSIKISDKMFLL